MAKVPRIQDEDTNALTATREVIVEVLQGDSRPLLTAKAVSDLRDIVVEIDAELKRRGHTQGQTP